jgi:hypothetical protein
MWLLRSRFSIRQLPDLTKILPAPKDFRGKRSAPFEEQEENGAPGQDWP